MPYTYEEKLQYNQQYNQELRLLRKSMGLCIRCNERAYNGHVYCLMHHMDANIQSRERYARLDDKKKAELSAKKSELYYKRKAERISRGECWKCGRKKDNMDTGYSLCRFCRAKENKYREKQRRAAGMVPLYMRGVEVCYECCKEPVSKDKKVCESCRQKLLLNLEKARQNLPTTNYFRQANQAFWNEKKGKQNGETDKIKRTMP